MILLVFTGFLGFLLHDCIVLLHPENLVSKVNHLPVDTRDLDGHPILDSIADGVFTVDEAWRITSFNRAAEEITGYSREEAIGKRCSDVFCANVCHGACTLRRTIETNQKLINVRVEIEKKNGIRVPISISTAVLHDREGRHVGGVETFRDLTALDELRKQVDEHSDLEAVVGHHPKMKEILEIVPDVSRSDATVLIQGPSGSGKGLLAKTIHNLSSRRDKTFVKVNCAALPETLLESELFGYEKGAFTDAKKDKPGRIALAEGGTLFLDEIGDVPPQIQVKLLRVVHEREYEALGGTITRVANVRIIAATNRDLVRLMEEGQFREDLFYRLNIVGFELPSLAERREDIPRLVDRILKKLCDKSDRMVGISERAMELIMAHDFPGNVRELENAIEHTLVLCRGDTIEEKHLPATIRKSKKTIPEQDPLSNVEARAILTTLEQCDGNRNEAAKRLGLHRTTLWRKMRRYGLV